jgi:hypothetical protein
MDEVEEEEAGSGPAGQAGWWGTELTLCVLGRSSTTTTLGDVSPTGLQPQASSRQGPRQVLFCHPPVRASPRTGLALALTLSLSLSLSLSLTLTLSLSLSLSLSLTLSLSLSLTRTTSPSGVSVTRRTSATACTEPAASGACALPSPSR